MKVRWKLVAILAVPLAALLGLAGLGVSQRNSDANDAEQAADLTLLASKVTAAANDLQLEANWSAWFITTGGLQGSNELKEQRVKTDASMTTLHDSLVGFDSSAFSDDFSTKLTLTADRMLGYQMIRPSVDQLAQNGSDPIALYALAGSQLLDLNTLIADESPDDSLAGAFSSYVAGSKAKQFNSDSFSIITESLGGAVLTDQHYSQLVRTQFDHQTQLGVFLSLATPEQKERYRRTVSGPAVSATEDGVTEVITAGVGAPITLDATDWQADTITTLTLGRNIETDVENNLLSQASRQKSDAQRDVIAYALLALSAAAFAIASAAFLGRAITRPLRRLAVAAHEVADEQLPSLVEALRNPSEDGSVAVPAITPVERTSRDEVGDLAEAFASIQQTAVDVAIEQSNLLRKGIGELFVNLARRNQSLLDRQIGFLDQLEAAETDPDALENLFKLDHLATRMRRNAESLLVLAGIEAPRRWGKPVALGDVVRAAVGEVEDYSRVHVAALDDVYVLGNAAADVAHLLSELLDNATQFSAPGTRVEVIGRRKGGGYLLSVSDLGIGMTGQQLAEANELLAHPPVTGLTLSRSLGFIVVGRLAKRYGVTVELTSAAVGGLTALVEVPQSLLTTPASGDGFTPDPNEATSLSLLGTLDPQPPVGPLVASAGKQPAWTRAEEEPDAVWERLIEISPEQGVESDRQTVATGWDDGQTISGPWSDAPPSTPAVPVAKAPEMPAATVAAAATLAEAISDRPTIDAELASISDDESPVTSSGLPRRRAADKPANGELPNSDLLSSPLDVPAPSPLPRRNASGARSFSTSSAFGGGDQSSARASSRSPEEIRSLLSSYRSGLTQGRLSDALKSRTNGSANGAENGEQS
jgi:signal transduction histidine kinase